MNNEERETYIVKYRKMGKIDLLTEITFMSTFLHREHPLLRRMVFNHLDWEYRANIEAHVKLINDELTSRRQ